MTTLKDQEALINGIASSIKKVISIIIQLISSLMTQLSKMLKCILPKRKCD